MPAVSEQFKTFKSFAAANLIEIYGEKLDAAYKVTANQLKSGVYLNQTKQGKPMKFIWHELPSKAQLSPINDIAAADFDNDGKTELIFAMNHHTNWPETGLWRGTPGLHVEWTGSSFKALSYPKSGIVLPNDTKAILEIDANNDGKLDILAGQNDDQLLLFINQ